MSTCFVQPVSASMGPRAKIRAFTAVSVDSRLLMLSREKAGRKSARECSQNGPIQKVVNVSRQPGMKVRPRSIRTIGGEDAAADEGTELLVSPVDDKEL